MYAPYLRRSEDALKMRTTRFSSAFPASRINEGEELLKINVLLVYKVQLNIRVIYCVSL
jgi:hypothetical protein